MAIGKIPTKAEIDQAAPQLLLAIDNVLRGGGWVRYAEWLDRTADGVLTAAPYNYTQAEVNTLKAAFNLTEAVRDLWNAPNGARFNAEQLWGPGIG